MKCSTCGAALDLTMESCPSCGAAVDLGRLTGLLGFVCRACDAYNDPGARRCRACGAALGTDAEPTPPGATAAPAPRPSAVSAPDAPVVRSFQKGGATGTRIVAPAAAHTPSRPRARLVLERGEGPAGAVFPIDDAAVEAGRSRGALAFPADPCLAERHATFAVLGGALHVRDGGAPGGTFVQLRGQDAVLRPGDEVAVGDRRLRYAGPLAAAPAPAADGTRRLGAPRPTGAVVVEERLEGGRTGRVFVRAGPTVTIGRAGAAVDLGEDPLVAPAHAELRVHPDGTARLRDLGSGTGTFVRLPAGGERELREGDAVRIGREVLRVAGRDREA